MWIEKKSNITEQKFKVYINCTSFKKKRSFSSSFKSNLTDKDNCEIYQKISKLYYIFVE